MNCCNNTEFVKLPKIWDFLHFETDYVKYDLKWITFARNFSYLTSVIFFFMLGLALKWPPLRCAIMIICKFTPISSYFLNCCLLFCLHFRHIYYFGRILLFSFIKKIIASFLQQTCICFPRTDIPEEENLTTRRISHISTRRESMLSTVKFRKE